MFSRKTLLHAAALAAIALAPAVASAQSGGGNNPNTGQVTVGNLIAALNNISANIGELNALNDLTVSRVRLVDVDNVLNNNNVEALNNALNRNNTEILNLRNVLNDNEIVKNVLNGADIAITRVVAIDVLSGGDVIVFHQ
jgi:hypothetical protein